MKTLKVLIIALISFFMISPNAFAASSKFEPTLNMESDITENQINILLGFTGEEVMALEHTIAWNSKYLTFVDVYSIESFMLTKGEIKEDGDYRMLNIVVDSDTAYRDTNYAILTFELTSKFKKNSKSDVLFYNYEGAGSGLYKVRHKGSIMQLQRENESSMYHLAGKIDDEVKFKYWLYENYMLIIFPVVAVITGVVLVFLIPSKKRREAREKTVTAQSKSEKGLQKYGEYEPIKIDMAAIEKIGKENEAPVDMSEAIEVSEYQPFENNPSRVENNANIQSFGSIMEGTKEEVVEIPSLKEEEPINAFGQQQIVDAETLVVNENTKFDTGTGNSNEKIETLDGSEKLFEEIKDNPENLVLFQPSEFEHKDNNNINNIIIFLLLTIGALLIPFNVCAEEFTPIEDLELVNTFEDEEFTPIEDTEEETEEDEEYVDEITVDIDGIRNCVVGNDEYHRDYDLNDDKQCDVLDIMLTKDLSNINTGDDSSTGFEDIKGQSSIGIGENKDKDKTTTTTTNATPGFVTTLSRQPTTKKKTTKATTNKKKTTTKKTTTKKTTTTTTKPSYTVEIEYSTYGEPDNRKQTVTKGSKAYFVFTIHQGYKYSSVSCTNGQKASFASSTNKLTVGSVSANTVCTVTFKKRTDMKVTIKGINANKTSAFYLKGTYGESATITIKPKTGYQYKTLSCDNVVASYSGTTFTVYSMTHDDTCTIEFEPKPYNITIYNSSGTRLQTIAAKYETAASDHKFTVSENTYTKIKCKVGSTTKTITLASPTAKSGKYEYTFSYRVTGETTCTLS